MLKRPITYEDFEGNTITEEFYFNITKPELIELEVEVQEGFQKWIQKVIDADDHKTLVAQFKRIILFAYGEKSEDGKRFIKSEELSHQFSQTNAYTTLFMELVENEEVAAQFIIGIMPKDMQGDIPKAMTDTADPTK